MDSEFVAGCLHNHTDQVIIDALVDLSWSLGKQTIAEYVESAPVARFLQDRGVDCGQGYLFGRPAPLDVLSLEVPPAPHGRSRAIRPPGCGKVVVDPVILFVVAADLRAPLADQHYGVARRGRRIMNFAPCPGVDVTSRCPWCLPTTTERARLRP